MRQTIKGKPPSFTSFASSVADSKQTLTRGLLVISPQDRAKHYLCNLRCRIAFSASSSTIISSLTYNQESKRKTSINAPITCPFWNTVNAQSTRKDRNPLSKEKVNCHVAQTHTHTAETRQAGLSKAWPATHPHSMALRPCQHQPQGLLEMQVLDSRLYPLVSKASDSLAGKQRVYRVIETAQL